MKKLSHYTKSKKRQKIKSNLNSFNQALIFSTKVMLLVMYSGELEVQAKRKAVAVLQDEINRILNAGRSLSQLPELIVKKDKAGIKDAMEQITSLEEEVESLRRKITRDVADVGGLILNRENLLNTFDFLMNPIGGDINSNLFFTYPLSNKDLKILKLV